jgi:anti-anti-sigma factor
VPGPSPEEEATWQTERNGEVGLIRLDGELDMASYELVVEEIRKPELDGVSQWAVDCSDLTFMDSCGLRAILSLAGDAGSLGSVVLYEPQDQVRRLIETTGLGEVLRIRDDPSDA